MNGTIRCSKEEGASKFKQFVERQIPLAPQAEFDCLVMFSGGKDSTYLLHQLRHVYDRRVLAFTIDSGFDPQGFLDRVAVLAEKIDVPWAVVKPAKSVMAAFYRTILLNAIVLNEKADEANIMCATCDYTLRGVAAHFAATHGIPTVVNGLNRDQFGDRFARLTGDEVQSVMAFIKMRDLRMQLTYPLWQTFVDYQENPALRSLIDQAHNPPKEVRVVYPFLYQPYDIRAMIAFLVGEIGWIPPDGQEIEEYSASGCRLWDMIPYLVRLGLIRRLHELEELGRQVERGEEDERFYKALASELASADALMVEQLRPKGLLTELGLGERELETAKPREA